MVPWLDDLAYFPASVNALTIEDDADGLLCASTLINPELLHAAYSRGIYPWYNAGEPVMWWTPSQRAVLQCAAFKCSKSLAKTMRRWQASGDYAVRVDTAFTDVLAACADRPEGTWMSTELRAAYTQWHALGAVHSVECWHTPLGQAPRLIGGFYGVSLGGMFFGESMFSRETDASKVALACFVAWFSAQGGDWIDCQQDTAHLLSLGAQTMPRAVFEAGVEARVKKPVPNWAACGDLLKVWR